MKSKLRLTYTDDIIKDINNEIKNFDVYKGALVIKDDAIQDVFINDYIDNFYAALDKSIEKTLNNIDIDSLFDSLNESLIFQYVLCIIIYLMKRNSMF